MSKIAKIFSRLRKTVNQQPVVGYGLVVIGLITFGCLAFLICGLLSPQPVEAPDIVITKKPDPVYYSPLTGKKVKSEAATKQTTTAIMIENSPDARPQSGLKQSGVVYEAIAEGGITRFLAIYQEDKPQIVGPVRSLRQYFVDWLAPYDAAVAHVGGSAQALKIIRNGQYRDIDQFFNASTYWRAGDRYAPHNVYTSFKRIDALNKSKGYQTSEFTAFERRDGKPADQPTASKININFSSPSYNTSYRYNKKGNNYTRHLGGVPHKDREKGNITPSVVIAMRVNMHAVNEDGYREHIDTTGTGKATIFQDGQAIEATWRKSSRNAQLQFIDKDGQAIELVRGQTWIAAVPIGQGSVSW